MIHYEFLHDVIGLKNGIRYKSCYHHSIKEPTKVIELEPQENNIWNGKIQHKNGNVFYSKHIRHKASSDSSDENYATNVANSFTQNIRQQCPSDQNIYVSSSDNPAPELYVGKVTLNSVILSYKLIYSGAI